MPDYDGRGNPDRDADSWVRWIPRIALFPLYAVNEYVLRRPIGAVVSHGERERWSDSAAQVFGGGGDDDGKSSLMPTATYDSELRPSVGLWYQRRALMAQDNALAFNGETWGARWIAVAATDRYAIDGADGVELHAAFDRARDDVFYGLGPDAVSGHRSRYGLERGDVELGYRRALDAGDAPASGTAGAAGPDSAATGPTAWLEAGAGVERIGFLAATCCDDPSLDQRIARGELMAPPGYRDPYTAAFARFALELDTRQPWPAPGGGGFVRLEARPSLAGGGRAWLAYGGTVGGAIDLTGTRRTLSLQLATRFVDSLAGGAAPFSEDPVLAGDAMPGFAPGWLTGTSIAAAELAYRWPVWLGLDAQARFGVGNAFGDHLAGLAPGELRMAGDIGLTSDTRRGVAFDLLFGVGTETFDQGAHLASVRVTFDVTRSL